MAITNAAAVAFCDTRVRPAADRLAQAYNDASAVIDEWFAQGHSSFIPNDVGEIVQDTATTQGDGRTPITGADVNNLITRLTELTADFEATSNAKLNTVLKVAVNTTPG